MAISLKHSTVVVVPDDGTSPVGTDEWNAEHNFTMDSGYVLGRTSAGNGPVQQIIPPSAATVSATAPSSPAVGTLWWDTNSGQMYVWYDDGNSQQWVVANCTNASPIALSRVLIADVDPTTGQFIYFGPLTNAYDTYEIDGYVQAPAGTASSLALRVSTDNGASYINAAGAYWTMHNQTYGLGGSNVTAAWVTTDTLYYLSPGAAVATSWVTFNLTIRRPWLATPGVGASRWCESKALIWDGTNFQQFIGGGGYVAAGTAITHVALLRAGVANAWAGGFMRLYGRK